MTAANPLPFNVGYRLSLPSGRVHAGKDLIGSVTCLDTLDSLPKYTRELWQTKGHVKVELHQHREYTAFSYATSTVDIVASDTKPWYDLAIRTLGFRLSVPDYSPASTYGGKLIRVSYEIIVQLQIGDGAIIKCLVIMLASRASDSIGNK
ncbi:hypothetical protein BDF22DRAFT_407236 [Syncephalis plumigaleata]|nr:hypothetical protein BDF22DRAFT_407236 [Syncephalis plumigaleata]